MLRGGDVGIAVVDSDFPGTGNGPFVETLARDNLWRSAKVILTAARPSKELALTALRASVVDLLEKPLVPAALDRALRRATTVGSEAEAAALSGRLLDLSRELSSVANLIGGQAPLRRRPAPSPVASTVLPAGAAADVQGYVRRLLRDAALRRTIGGGELFGDPAWEMLLDLLLAQFEKRKVSVTSACIASGAPMTTALRLVRRLVEQEVLVRYPDASDRRREFLALHPAVARTLADYVQGECAQEGAERLPTS